MGSSSCVGDTVRVLGLVLWVSKGDDKQNGGMSAGYVRYDAWGWDRLL